MDVVCRASQSLKAEMHSQFSSPTSIESDEVCTLSAMHSQFSTTSVEYIEGF
jgi:hypothetical protein